MEDQKKEPLPTVTCAENPALAQLARETAALGLTDGYTSAASCLLKDWEGIPANR